MKQTNQLLLHNALTGVVQELTPSLSCTQQALLRDSLKLFIVAACCKYEHGQKEHGGDLRDRNHHDEMFMELIDLFWYHQAMSWPKDTEGKIQKVKL